MEKVFELILKGKLRLHQLADIEPEVIIVSFTADDIKSYGKTMNHGKGLVLIFWEKLIATIQKAVDLTL